jgi:D-alanyl-D-alanine dipeptidase
MIRGVAFALVLGCGAEPPVPREPAPLPSEPVVSVAPAPAIPAPGLAIAALRARVPPQGLVDVVAFVPHVRLAIGYATADNFTGAPLPGYDVAAAWLHPAATDGLAKAAMDLADDGLALVVFDAYRPRRASEAMVAWARANDREDLLRDGWVAARSQHNRGLALDVGLADLATGEPLDMGTAWDAFTPKSAAHALRGDAGDRRRRLRDALTRHGFAPYEREWWHFAWKASAPELDVPYGAHE